MRTTTSLLLLVVICNLSGSLLRADEPKQQAIKHDAQGRVTLDYLLYLPPDFEKQEAWPLVLFLHGAGERGDDLQLVKVHGPPKLVEEGKTFPFVVVSPQCPKGRSWQSMDLMVLVDDVVTKRKIDPDRIYVTGLSMGGFGTWALAASAPDRFAAIAPICGGGDVSAAKRLAHLPAWFFHGADDQTVPMKHSEDLVAALKKENGNVKFTVYPETGHNSWTETYANPEVYTWLLEQKRAPMPKAGE